MSDSAGGGGSAADATVKTNGEAPVVDLEAEHQAEIASAENALAQAKEGVKRAEEAVKEAKRGHK